MPCVEAPVFITLCSPLIYSVFIPFNLTKTWWQKLHIWITTALHCSMAKHLVCYSSHHTFEFRALCRSLCEDVICWDVLRHPYSPNCRAIAHHWDEVKWHVHNIIVLSKSVKEQPDTVKSEGKKDYFKTFLAPCWIHSSGCSVGTKGSHLVLPTWSYRNGYWVDTTHTLYFLNNFHPAAMEALEFFVRTLLTT